jgi:hypothetical protein
VTSGILEKLREDGGPGAIAEKPEPADPIGLWFPFSHQPSRAGHSQRASSATEGEHQNSRNFVAACWPGQFQMKGVAGSPAPDAKTGCAGYDGT